MHNATQDRDVRALVRPTPHPDEGARGYLLRYCEANGLERLSWLRCLRPHLGTVEAGGNAFASLCGGTDPIHLIPRGPVANAGWLNVSDAGCLPTRYWNTRRSRVCPRCIAERGYLRASWDLLFVTVCAEHRCLLIDHCGSCGRPLGWSRKRTCECSCGANLRDVETDAAEDSLVALTREIVARLEQGVCDGGAIAPLGELDLESLLRLVWLLGAYAQEKQVKPQKIGGLWDLSVALRVVRAAAAALTEWPAGFRTFLSGLADAQVGTTRANRLAKRYGSFYHAIFASFNQPPFGFLFAALEQDIGAQWHGQLAARHRRLSSTLRASHEWMPTKQAAMLLGVREPTVRRFIAAGLLVGQVYESTAGRKMGSVSHRSLDELIESRSHWISLRTLRERLGLSRKQAYRLLDDRVIKPVLGPGVDGSAVWIFDDRELPESRDRAG